MITFNNSWDEVLAPLFENPEYLKIREFLKTEYKTQTIYPNMHDIFNCFKITDYNSVKAVILGQDPYHGYGQAHGLSFSVKEGVKFPPSLKNIFTELESDLGYAPPKSGDLTKWAERGVLLLNTVLTVREGTPNSHKNCGWQWFTDEVISLLSKREEPIVFILWGGNARSKKRLIDLNKHFIIESAHPSPLSCYNGFWNSKPFSKTNAILEKVGVLPINWNLND
ncbi:MAG: uracil-DNA glycosylase [Clostridia bacterium]|nr:uracil-DNA glycosylase [Clostridia bacterium]